jgi:hypothetical protein
MTWWLGMLGFVVPMITFVIGYIAGHSLGVKETEQRWSDAVAVKEDREQCPMYDPQCTKNHHRFDHLKPYRSDR